MTGAYEVAAVVSKLARTGCQGMGPSCRRKLRHWERHWQRALRLVLGVVQRQCGTSLLLMGGTLLKLFFFFFGSNSCSSV